VVVTASESISIATEGCGLRGCFVFLGRPQPVDGDVGATPLINLAVVDCKVASRRASGVIGTSSWSPSCGKAAAENVLTKYSCSVAVRGLNKGRSGIKGLRIY
jgi:hypothetical protein